MIQATTIHHSTLTITDERTAHLADAIHNMGAWLNGGIMTEETFVRIHDILRANLDTENFLSVVKHSDQREESNEYHIIIAEFPEKSDGTIRSLRLGEEDNQYFLLTKEEEILEAIENATTNTTDKKEQN